MPVVATPVVSPPPRSDIKAFQRIIVDYAIRGTARISWWLEPRFYEAEPWSFQLQVADTDVSDPTAWSNVGSPVVGVFQATDSTPRAFGKNPTVYYRVVLTTGIANVYTSPTADVLGRLDFHNWAIYWELVRKEVLRLQRLKVGTEGYLLRARLSGTPCTACTDADTEEQTDGQCPTCFGQRFVGGYYVAESNIFADEGLLGHSLNISPQGVGMTDPATKREGRFIAIPNLVAYDVWVNKAADLRYYVRPTKVLAQLRGVPVAVEVELQEIPFDSILYTFPVPNH